MGVIAIDYNTLTLVAILLFAAVGFTRGWLKEGVTTALLVALVGLLYKPELVKPIASYINKIVKLIQVILADGLRFDLSAMAKSAGSTPDAFLPDNPYNFLMWALVILIALSYIGTRYGMADNALSPLSRILGGLAGAINGFIAISLFKEYAVGYFQHQTTPAAATAAAATASAQAGAAPANGLSVAVQNVPQVPFLTSVGPLLAIMAGAMIVILILSTVFKTKPSSAKKNGS
jgi:hypothetical protein